MKLIAILAIKKSMLHNQWKRTSKVDDLGDAGVPIRFLLGQY